MPLLTTTSGASVQSFSVKRGGPRGPGVIFAGGYSANVPFFKVFRFYNDGGTGNFNTQWNIDSTAVGYKGQIDIYVLGSMTKAHLNFNGENPGNYPGMGENAKLTYTALGDETSFQVAQYNRYSSVPTPNWSSGASYAQFTINGGVNNGDVIRWGSAMQNSNSFGVGGAGGKFADEASASFTLSFQGGYRINNSGLYYSDNFFYSPNDYASYGTYNNTTNYPNGSYVQFSSGKIAIVDNQGSASGGYPDTVLAGFSFGESTYYRHYGYVVLAYTNDPTTM